MLVIPNNILVPPTDTIVSLDEAKKHLRLEHTNDDDTYVESLLYAAEEYVKARTGISISSTTYEVIMECFPETARIELQFPPVTTVSVFYYDSANVYDEFVDYSLVRKGNVSSCIKLNSGFYWPGTYLRPDAVRLTYVGGFTQTTVPKSLKHAILLLVGSWFMRRESVVLATTATISKAMEHSLDALCRQFKTWRCGGNTDL